MKHLELLERAYAQEKLAHAYLFSGNDKAEKERVIEGFVQLLVGPQKNLIQGDVVNVSPETNEITIGQIRNLKKQLSLSSWFSPFRIGIIRSAEAMNQEAQSAFLKLLEEPRGDVILLLEVQHSSLLLDTIRSRTQELRMYRFDSPQKEVAGLLPKLKGTSLADRFGIAERESQDPKALYETLLKIQREARSQLLGELQEGRAESLRILKCIAEVLSSLRVTQVNARYAAERVLLEL
ncbi:MAG: hypothetical protein Q8P55_00530 [bacterium]|nr:hypothetical protein [bacterium]